MSRGFVKEGDQEEIPVIPPRAALPQGVMNYVTPNGHQELLQEKEDLENEKRNLSDKNERERRQDKMFIDGKIKLLNQRINSARIISLEGQDSDEVRFGATVKFNNGKKELQFQIVGVDEANIKKRKIAFTAPIAKALIGKKVGEVAEFKRGSQVQKLKVLEIDY